MALQKARAGVSVEVGEGSSLPLWRLDYGNCFSPAFLTLEGGEEDTVLMPWLLANPD